MIQPNNIYLGDCYDLIKQIPDKSVDLIITDPPYKIPRTNSKTGIFKYRDFTVYDEIADKKLDKSIDLSILDEMCRVLKHIYIYIYCNKEQIRDYLNYFMPKKCNFEFIIWGKTNTPPFTGGHYLKDKEYCLLFWEKGCFIKGDYKTLKTVYMSQINTRDKALYKHPTIKPIEQIKNFIINSTQENDIVLDPFCGSGTTLKACKDLNRQYIGFEINPKYYQIAVDRLNNLNQRGEYSLF